MFTFVVQAAKILPFMKSRFFVRKMPRCQDANHYAYCEKMPLAHPRGNPVIRKPRIYVAPGTLRAVDRVTG